MKKFKLFVFGKACIDDSKGKETLVVEIQPRKNSRPECPVCGRRRAVYDPESADPVDAEGVCGDGHPVGRRLIGCSGGEWNGNRPVHSGRGEESGQAGGALRPPCPRHEGGYRGLRKFLRYHMGTF